MSIIQTLIRSSNLVLYHDYRSRSFLDHSTQGNDGTPTSTAWAGNGNKFLATTSVVTVSDAAELQITEGTLVVLADFVSHTGAEHLISKMDAGGTNYDFYLDSSSDVKFYDGASTRTLNNSVVGGKYLAVNFADTETPEGFLDGISIGNFSGAVSISADDAPLKIGNIYSNSNNFLSNLKAVLIINRKLTDLEHAQLYGELISISWPTKPDFVSSDMISVNPNETGLVGGWILKNDKGVIDQSASGFDGTVYGVVDQKSLIGDCLRFNGINNYIDFGNVGTIKSIAFWIKPTTTSEDIADMDGGTHTIEVAGGTLTATGWAAPTIYINGAASTTLVAGVWQRVVITSSTGFAASAFKLGMETTYFDGLIGETEIYSDEKSSAWVATDYARISGAMDYKSNWGANVSVSNQTSGSLGGTGINIDSGTWNISEDTIDGVPVKVIESIAVGTCYIDMANHCMGDASYGSWEFYYWKPPGGNSNLNFMPVASVIGNFNASGQNGYLIQVNSLETLLFGRSVFAGFTTLASTPVDYVSLSTWHKIKLTRSIDGEFTLYFNDTIVDVTGGSGTNPVTDTTHSTSSYMIINSAVVAGDKIAIASINGDYSIKKHLGVV